MRNREKDNVKKNDADRISILPGCWLKCRPSGGGGSCHLPNWLPLQRSSRGGGVCFSLHGALIGEFQFWGVPARRNIACAAADSMHISYFLVTLPIGGGGGGVGWG